MQDILDLLTFIAENMGKGEGLESIRETIRSQGYSENEITLALNYLLLASNAHQEKSGCSKARILHPVEDMFISPEAYGHLVKLRTLRIIDDAQLESIIEQALMETDRIVDIDEMKKAAYKVLFRPRETDSPSPLPEEDEEGLPIH